MLIFAAVCTPRQHLTHSGVQRVILETSDPIVWPAGTGAGLLAPGSVNMFDCQNGILALRNRNFVLETQFGTILYYRCNVIFPDMHEVWTTTTYWYDATGIFPCNVRCTPHLLLISVLTCCSSHLAVLHSATLAPSVYRRLQCAPDRIHLVHLL